MELPTIDIPITDKPNVFVDEAVIRKLFKNPKIQKKIMNKVKNHILFNPYVDRYEALFYEVQKYLNKKSK